MKLLILTQKVDSNDDNLGFFHRWIEEFAAQCERVIVICLYEGKHDLPSSVRVLSLGKEGGVSRIKYLRRFFTYIWRERNDYDAVFVHMNQIYVVLGGLLWRWWGKRIGLWYAHGAISLSLRLATMMADVAFTSTDRGLRIRTPKKRIIGQGIDAALFTQKRDYTIGPAFRIVTSGRIAPPKDVEGMIDLVVALAKEDIPATLTLIGSGEPSYVEELKRYAHDRGAGERVSFLGGIPYKEFVTMVASYDVFLNLGKTGSLDKAILDAGAARLPVVTTNADLKAFAIDASPFAALRDLYRMEPPAREAYALRLHEWVTAEHSLAKLVMMILSHYA